MEKTPTKTSPRSRSFTRQTSAESGAAEVRSNILSSSTRPKTQLRAQQRKHTRAKIVSAALVEFEEKRFHYATVDDITSRANISRATFYTHFRGKEEVLLEIVIQKHSTKHLSFVALQEAPRIDEAVLTNWLKTNLMRRFAEDREWLFSYYVVCDLYANMANFFSDGRDEIIDFLGQRFAAFRCTDADGKPDHTRRARGHLELYKLEQFGLHAVYPGLSLPVDMFAGEVASGFLAFLQSDEIGPPVPSSGRCQTDN